MKVIAKIYPGGMSWIQKAEYVATVRKKAMFTDPEDAKFCREFGLGSKITTNRTIDLGQGFQPIYTVWEIEPRLGLKRKPKETG